MKELSINLNNVLPEIFFATNEYLKEVNENLTLAFEKYQENGVQDFYSNFNNFLNNGWKYLKTGLGDVCVGLKTFGDKMASLGGESFSNLGVTTSGIVAKTGEFFNYVDNLTIQVNELMQQEPNAEKFEEISNTLKNYIEFLSNSLIECSNNTLHLYGDAKEVLGENFNRLSEGLLRFIQNVKLKCILGITTICVSFKIALDYLYAENTVYEMNLLEDGAVSKDAIGNVIAKVLCDLEFVKVEAKKIFNN